jgi:tol-pal system protein YbgF
MQAAVSETGLSADTMVNQALRDFAPGDFDMAIEGFNALVEAYPSGETAAKALLRIGDSYSSQNRLKEAADAFTRVINNYPQASVVPTALFKRAKVEAALQDRDSAVADFRDIIQRFPSASEADSARAELQ